MPTSQEYSEEQSRHPVGASSDAESGEGRVNPALEQSFKTFYEMGFEEGEKMGWQAL